MVSLAPTFLDISRVIGNHLHVKQFSCLHDAGAFPTIGKNGPQVCGITVNGSVTPFLCPCFERKGLNRGFLFETKTEVIATSYQNSLFSGVTAHATKNHQITRFGLNLA